MKNINQIKKCKKTPDRMHKNEDQVKRNQNRGGFLLFFFVFIKISSDPETKTDLSSILASWQREQSPFKKTVTPNYDKLVLDDLRLPDKKKLSACSKCG